MDTKTKVICDKKFQDMKITADGKERASVELDSLKTLWFNTGTRCNLSCNHCYIESTPTNDQLSYITADEVESFLLEIHEQELPTKLIGLTGGEPFLNPDIIQIIERTLKHKLEILVLTNAYRVINRHIPKLEEIKNIYGDKLHLRISLDHHSKEFHEKERGEGTFYKTLENIKLLVDKGFNISLAGRSLTDEDLEQATNKYKSLMKEHEINIELNSDKIVVFPEMDLNRDVPEISTGCWDILGKKPSQQMCATERMIVKRKGEQEPTVLPCTLIAYDKRFDLGKTLKTSQSKVYLNHKFCAQFCVLGGASCSSAK